jgi:hypothetical protein
MLTYEFLIFKRLYYIFLLTEKDMNILIFLRVYYLEMIFE